MATTETEREAAREGLEHLHVMIRPDQRDRIIELAQAEMRSIGSMTRVLLAQGLERRAEDGDS